MKIDFDTLTEENKQLKDMVRSLIAIVKVYEKEIPLDAHPELNAKVTEQLAHFDTLEADNARLNEVVSTLQNDNAKLILERPPLSVPSVTETASLPPETSQYANDSIAQPYLENIPQVMKDAVRWAVWQRHDDGRKIPFRVLDDNAWSKDQCAKCNDASTWTTFHNALQCYQKSNGHLHGLAFALGDDYCGFDFDDCIIDGKTHPQVEAWLTQLGGYQEPSQSGRGKKSIHFGSLSESFLGTATTGKQFKNIPAPGMATEVYDKGRFFFLTGLGRGEPTEKPVAIVEICQELQAAKDTLKPKPKPRPRPRPQGDSVQLSDTAILEKIRNSHQADKFSALWTGHTAQYASPSEADLALSSILAWWCNYDMVQVERLFEQSELAKREKWDRDDYRQLTLNAIEKRDGYQPKPLSKRQQQALEARNG